MCDVDWGRHESKKVLMESDSTCLQITITVTMLHFPRPSGIKSADVDFPVDMHIMMLQQSYLAKNPTTLKWWSFDTFRNHV